MHVSHFTLLALILSASLPAAPADWATWRGPDHTGHADPDQSPPTEFGADRNALWATPLPGKGHGSPIVVGERVFLATADEASETQLLVCLEPVWVSLFRPCVCPTDLITTLNIVVNRL